MSAGEATKRGNGYTELEPDGLGSMDIGNLVPWAADGLSEVPQQGRSRLAGDPLVESGVEERVGGCAMAPRSMVSWAWIMALHFELCLRQSVFCGPRAERRGSACRRESDA